MSRLWLARHGDAGPGGFALTADGRRQADLLGARLAGAGITRISHSPLPRAVETAEIVARHLPGVPVEAAEELTDAIPPEGTAAMTARFTDPVDDELVITHGFQIGWFVREVLEAPPERWQNLNSCNTGLTVIRWATGRAPVPLIYNDISHLPPELRWTGFPADLRL